MTNIRYEFTLKCSMPAISTMLKYNPISAVCRLLNQRCCSFHLFPFFSFVGFSSRSLLLLAVCSLSIALRTLTFARINAEFYVSEVVWVKMRPKRNLRSHCEVENSASERHSSEISFHLEEKPRKVEFITSLQTICETQPPASIGWVALSSVVRSSSSRISNISSHLHYLMFPSIQTIYFLWGYDPGNMSVPTYLLLLSWAQFTVV